MSKTPWQLMFAGHREEALRLMRKAYALRASASTTTELGVAYLWVEDYRSAWAHFNAANQRQPKHAASFYQMAGTAKWCLGERYKGVEQWVEGCDCDYADFAGGVESPLLLFTASIIDPAVFARSEAEKLLTVRANEERVRNWPGAVAEYVLGRIDEARLREKCAGVNDRDTASRHWRSDFYVGILELAAGNVANYVEWMRKVAAPTPIYAGPRPKRKFDFVDKLWCAEFFIARHELVRWEPTARR